jgi:hypothetical protein
MMSLFEIYGYRQCIYSTVIYMEEQQNILGYDLGRRESIYHIHLFEWFGRDVIMVVNIMTC